MGDSIFATSRLQCAWGLSGVALLLRGRGSPNEFEVRHGAEC